MTALKRGLVVDDAINHHRGVIVQADDALRDAVASVLVVPLSDASRWGGPRRWVHQCDRTRNGSVLTKDSVAIVPWVAPVQRKMLAKKTVLGALHPDDLDQIEVKLRLIFDL